VGEKYSPLSGSQMNFFISSQNYGNSVFDHMASVLTQPSVTVLDQSQVDQDQWYTVDVDPVVAVWVRQQPREHWHEHAGRTFRSIIDVHEHLYSMIRLKF
jgi:hypothetical protein